MTGIGAVVLIVAVSQMVGLAASRVARNVTARLWLGSVVAGATFAIGWWFWGAASLTEAAAHGQRTCGAGGALVIAPLLFVTPANVVLAMLVLGLINIVESRRHGSMFGPR